MKKLLTALPLALLLAYCSGPNNTQTNSDTEIDATSTASTTTTTGTGVATTSEVSDETTVTTGIHSDQSIGNVTVDHSTSVINPIPTDPNNPMHRHWPRKKPKYWT